MSIVSNISTSDKNILVVDDKERVRESLALSLSTRGFQPFTSDTVENGWQLILKEPIDLALIDIQLGESSGLELLERIQNMDRPIPAILFTGYGTIESAIEAIKLGAFNYLQKPIKTEQLVASINSALRLRYLEEENSELQNRVNRNNELVAFGQVTGKIHHRAQKLARTDLPILVLGESGTGKEMFAELIHQNSDRKDAPLVKVNCAALPDNLIDDELFGHEKGAFTGAENEFKGVFERADSGTLFLDEIGDMPLATQAKILRAIQNHEVKKIGSGTTMSVDVRFIAATNKDLETLVSEGRFREDLYYRLSTAVINLPPLRERKDEILPLANHFLSMLEKPSFPNYSLTPAVSDLLTSYQWPGNIRELKSSIQYAAAISPEPEIGIDDLPRKLSEMKKTESSVSLRKRMELDLIVSSLEKCGNNKRKAAEMMGISRATLYNKLREYGI